MIYELLNYLIACTAQVGMTPEEVVSKIMANPEVAVAFQNPKIQTAIMDVRPCRNSSFTVWSFDSFDMVPYLMQCSQNPLNIVKYQNDKEVCLDPLDCLSHV
jgi:hypothetical protein